MINGTGDDDNGAGNDDNDTGTYILKAKKFAEPAFQSKKKLREKVRVIFGPFWVILGPFWAFLGHFGSYLCHFGSFWVIFGPFRGIFGQICGKFNFFLRLHCNGAAMHWSCGTRF